MNRAERKTKTPELLAESRARALLILLRTATRVAKLPPTALNALKIVVKEGILGIVAAATVAATVAAVMVVVVVIVVVAAVDRQILDGKSGV